MYMVLYKTRSFGVWSVVFNMFIWPAGGEWLPRTRYCCEDLRRRRFGSYTRYVSYDNISLSWLSLLLLLLRTLVSYGGFYFISFNVFGTFISDPAKSWPPLRATRRRWAGYRARLVLYAVVVGHYYNKHLIHINVLYHRNYRFFDSGP